MDDDEAIEVGDVRHETVPAYVHRLVEAVLRYEPVSFEGVVVPDEVAERINDFLEQREVKVTELDIADSDVMARLNALLGSAVGREMGGMIANDDFSWMRMSLGVLAKMNVRFVGWHATLGERAILWADGRHYDEPPDDEHDWQPMFAFGD